MILKLLVALVVTLNVVSVLSKSVLEQNEFDHDPQVAMLCGKLNQHVNIKTGKWVSSDDTTDTCKSKKKDVLSYCKKVYPKLDIRNIVDANDAVTIEKWCDPAKKDCTGSKEVVPYRCLVGEFEADALLVPNGCRFEHLHKSSKCKTHEQWRLKAVAKCKAQDMHLASHGVLLPCEIDKFTGIEFVCCPKKSKKTKTDAPTANLKVINLTDTPTETPTEVDTDDEVTHLVVNFEKSVPPKSLGCDRKKYQIKRQKMEDVHRERVSDVIKQWEGAEKRYNVIKKDDPAQAENMIKGVMDRFKKTVSSLEEQARLERERLRDEHHQCVQIDVNNKKHKAMKDFVKAMKQTTRNPNKILEAVQRFVKICTQDRLHNLRHFEFVKKHFPKKAEEIRGILQQHLKRINEHVNQSMILLYKLPEIASQFRFVLPDWAPRPPTPRPQKPTTVSLPKQKSTSSPTEGPLPTERPTELPSEHQTDYSTEVASAEIYSTVQLTEGLLPTERPTELPSEHQTDYPTKVASEEFYSTVQPTTEDDEGEPEVNEHGGGVSDAQKGDPEEKKRHWSKRSPTTLAAVIGLSCGALVIMVIIIIAMAVRRTGAGRGPTKTVLVDSDSQSGDKQHLLEMQKNGYENPTYKFFDY